MKIDEHLTSQLTEYRYLVVGLVRNCAHSVEADIAAIEKSLQNSVGVKWLLIESDSGDGTLDVLSKIAGRDVEFNYISLGKLHPAYPLRTDRIAQCRNRYLHEIKKNKEYRDIDYVVVADFDGINNAITAESFASCFTRTDWDVCCANQISRYYDIWALRHHLWSPNDAYEQFRFMGSKSRNSFISYYVSVTSRMMHIPKESEWIEVDSAFGGMAIYKFQAFISSEYCGLTENGTEICEHVQFNKKIKENGYKIYINPAFINAVNTEHVRSVYIKTILLLIFNENIIKKIKHYKNKIFNN